MSQMTALARYCELTIKVIHEVARLIYSFLSYGPWIFRLLLGGMTNLFAAASQKILPARELSIWPAAGGFAVFAPVL